MTSNPAKMLTSLRNGRFVAAAAIMAFEAIFLESLETAAQAWHSEAIMPPKTMSRCYARSVVTRETTPVLGSRYYDKNKMP
jgi:hypothetical protein